MKQTRYKELAERDRRARDAGILVMYRMGMSQAEIGRQTQLTREAVRLIIRREEALVAKES